MSNKKNGESLENVEGMGGCRLGESGNEGLVFGASKNFSGLDSSLENLGFVFGANNTSSSKFNSKSKNGDRTNKSSSASHLNVSNKEPDCSESNGNSKSKLEFGQRKSSGNVGQPQGDDVKNCSSESHINEQSSIFHFEKVTNGSTLQSGKLNANFVFGAGKPNFDLRNGVCNKDEAYRGPEYQGRKLNGTSIFGCGDKGKNKVNENGKIAEDGDNFNREKTQNHNGCLNAQKSDIDSDGKLKFDSSGRNIVDTDIPKNPIYKLSDEMNSLSIGQSAPVNGAEKTNDLNEKSHVNIQNVFVFGFNESTSNISTENGACNSCDLPKDVNLKDPVGSSGFDKADTIDGEPNAKKACASEFVENFASSLKVSKDRRMPGETDHTNSNFGLSSEKINSFSFSAGTSGKENQPINFNSEIGASSEMLQNSLNSDIERDKMPLPLFTPESFGSQHKVDTPEAPPGHQAEKKEEFSFPSTPFIPGKSFSDFSASISSKSFSFTANLFSGVNEKLGCGTSSRLRDKKVKKKSLRQETLVQRLAGQTDLSSKNNSTHNDESPGCCSPMDFSPYEDTNSSTSADNSTRATETKEDVVAAKDAPFFSDSKKKCGEGNEKFSGTESGKESDSQRDFSSYTSLSTQDGLSSIRRQYRKKYKLKVDSCSNNLNHRKVSTDAVQHSSFGRKSSADIPSGVTSHMRNKGIHMSKVDEDHEMLGLTVREACEKWRIRGNQAYKAGNLSQAEDLYTKGIKSVSSTEISGSCLEPLLLCYSNRAATRMSLRRMREAISDCASAAALDPHFLKVKLRAANCYLVLGEVEEAIKYYTNCLESRINLCLDRRITIEAAEGLQKAQKVSEHLRRCAELLQQRTPDAAKNALGITNEALSISCYSEKLLEMKGEALCKLQMYNEVIELCQKSLDIAEKNFTSGFTNLDDLNSKNSSLMLWRWHLKSRSHFHLGELEMALDLIEKQEQMVSVGKRSGNMTQESSFPLAATIRELLHHKKAGNEAYKSGKYLEAIEHYTAAISSSVESRPFAAICFCNRAAAHQALGQIVDAIADCSLAIALDKNYAKAVSRRATLHEMIRDYGHAVNDLERLISLQETQSQERARQSEALDKSNGSSAKEAKRTRRQLSSIQEKAKRGTTLDLYLILGIKSSDTESDIKKAYRKAALRHHPDKAGQILARSDAVDDGGLWNEISETVRNDADRLFKLIGEAYAVLSNTDKRAKHDLEEEMRDVQRESARNSSSCSRPSGSYSSPFERTNWSRRQSNFYTSPFGKSSSRHYGQEYWRTYGESHPRW
ncbi:hypothetical protein HAX54_007066 [Datura stramonium]|uniref:J domain-containing protein n=1 Tax=Datura stramonium TaxID=4076 RepID=A0ABS8TB68_DATST|nr:hypothetical protein [Datura stramonium]